MKQIRMGVFETNSSSTHSMTVCTESQYEDWQNGKLLLDYHGNLVEANEDNLQDEDLKTYDDWTDSDYLEHDTNRYTSPSGDKLVIVCKYGMDN
jgi:hypothetical protein